MKNLLKVVFGAAITLGGGLISSAYAVIPGPSYTYQNGYVDSTNNLLFDQETATSALPASVCTQANVSRNYYLAGDTNGDGIKDLGTSYYARDNFVMNGGSIPVYLIGGRQSGFPGTKVRYFLPAGGQNMLTKLVGTSTLPLNTNSVWYRQSKIAPKDVWVRAVESHPLLVSAPDSNSIASRTFQIAYEIAYRPFSAKIAGTNNYWLYPTASPTDGGAVFNTWYISSSWTTSSPIWPTHYVLSTSSVTSAAISWGSESRVPYECMNVTVHWCGDGIVDVGSFNIGSASEICDLGSLNGQPGSTCSAMCTPIAPPPPSDMTVTKSVTGSTIQGNDVIYTITYRNLGAGTATGVVITDTLGTGLTFLPATSIPGASSVVLNADGTTTIKWNIGNVAPGAVGTIVFRAQIKMTVPNCSTVQNKVNVASTNDSNSLNNDAIVTSPIQCPPVVLPPDLAIAKSVTGSNVQSGILNYTILYNNIATGAATGVVITDILGTGIDFVSSVPAPTSVVLNANGTTTIRYNIGTVVGHAGGVITMTTRIRGNTPNCVTVRNDVSISAVTPEITLFNNSAFATSPIQCPLNPQLFIQKDVAASTGGYVPNGFTIYTLTYGNSGSGTATGVVLTDTLPADLTFVSAIPSPSAIAGQTLTWNIGTLLPGQTGIIRILVRIRSTVPVCANYIVDNLGIITATNAAPAQDNAQFLVLCYDLYSSKIIDKPLVISGDIVTYTIRYGNSGQIAAPNRSLVDSLPAGTQYISGSVVILSGINIGHPIVAGTTAAGQTLTWTGFTNMAPGYSGLVSIQAQIVTQFASGHIYRNVVCIEGDNNYNNNNCGEATTTTTGDVSTTGFFDINLQKTIDKSVAADGETVTYTIRVMNESDVPSPVNGYTVQDYLPAGIDYLGNPTGPSGMNVILSGAKDITFYNLPQLNPGDSITITFQGTYRSTVVETNYAEVCVYIGVSATSGIKDRDSNPCNRGRNTGVEDDESQASVGPIVIVIPPGGGGGGGGGGPYPYCGDGLYQPSRGEECDPGNAALGIKPAGVPPGRVCGPDCKFRDQPPGMTAEVKCSYIDPPAINVGEYMPYRWDMEYGYTTAGSGRLLVTSSCTTQPKDVRVNLTSLQCKFDLQGPNGHVITWTQPCYDNPHLPLIDTAFNAAKITYGLEIYPGGAGAKQITGSYYLGLGEYMITMKVVSGRLCNGASIQPYDRVCQMNFGVTKQYAVSRTPRGTFSSTPDLDTYKRQDTTMVLTVSELIQALKPFTLGGIDINLITKMVDKYIALAVKADIITDKLPDNTTIQKAVVSKVPSKNIFVIDAKTPAGTKGMITVLDKMSYKGGAFTLIVINGDIVIKGDLKQNPNGMFIARDGDIIFSAQGDAKTNNQNQEVHGIFIGLKDIKAEGDGQPAFNSDLNKPWINGGRLTINGILLGADLSDLIKGRRSVVENWFDKRAADGLLSDGAIVIKANPTIFTNLPPGAEDLSLTLNVFKK